MSGLELLHYLENQCKSLSEWKEKEVIVKKISKNLYTHIQEIVTKNGCKITWDKEKNRIIISKPQESEEDLLAGLDELVDENGADVDWSDTMKKIEEVSKKEREVAKMENVKYLLYQSLRFNEWIVYLLENYKRLEKKKVLWKLEELDKIIFNYDVIWDEKERENILLGLNTLKRIYSRDKDISEKLQIIIEKVEKSKINPSIN